MTVCKKKDVWPQMLTWYVALSAMFRLH